MSITIARPGRKFKSKQGNPYVVVDIEGQSTNVMLDDEVIEDWDNIETMTFSMKKFTKKTATEADVATGKAEKIGDLFDEDQFIPKVTDYLTFGRNDKLADVKSNRDARARKLLKETVLSAGEVAELEEAD